ncbi:hypothetical protein LZ554_004368 [Drepanopeziza brunnea f. sp. 'monogermtubi']|nr:hypothetical protein LZ554_004368 [Drepanopeziza brunnea f. sp. 'monogermtubi']
MGQNSSSPFAYLAAGIPPAVNVPAAVTSPGSVSEQKRKRSDESGAAEDGSTEVVKSRAAKRLKGTSEALPSAQTVVESINEVVDTIPLPPYTPPTTLPGHASQRKRKRSDEYGAEDVEAGGESRASKRPKGTSEAVVPNQPLVLDEESGLQVMESYELSFAHPVEQYVSEYQLLELEMLYQYDAIKIYLDSLDRNFTPIPIPAAVTRVDPVGYDPNGVPLEAFTVFGNLAPELRQMIWEYALEDSAPRILAIQPEYHNHPPLVHACHESRRICSEDENIYYISSVQRCRVFRYFVNYQKDTIYLNHTFSRLGGKVHNSTIQATHAMYPQVLDLAENLAINVREFRSLTGGHRNPQNTLWTMLTAWCPNLKCLSIVANNFPSSGLVIDFIEVPPTAAAYTAMIPKGQVEAIQDIQRAWSSHKRKGAIGDFATRVVLVDMDAGRILTRKQKIRKRREEEEARKGVKAVGERVSDGEKRIVEVEEERAEEEEDGEKVSKEVLAGARAKAEAYADVYARDMGKAKADARRKVKAEAKEIEDAKE